MKRGRDRNVPLQKAVRIVVLGDAGTGKSSLITVFISAHFEENLSSVIPVAVSRTMNSGKDIEMTEHTKTGLAARSNRGICINNTCGYVSPLSVAFRFAIP